MSRASSPSDVLLTLPRIVTGSQSTALRRSRSPVTEHNALAMLRRIQGLEEQNALLLGRNQDLEKTLENQRALMKNIVGHSHDEKKSLGAENAILCEENRLLKAQVENLTRIVKRHGLESEVKFAPKKPGSPAGTRVGSPSTTKRDQLFQLPKAPFGSSTSVRPSPNR